MIPVSDAYAAAVKNPNRIDRMVGAIVFADGKSINITDDIIVNGSATLKEQLVSGNTMEIGTFYTNEFNITVYDEDFLNRSYANAQIIPYYSLQLPDESWENVPLGIFTVDNSYTVRKGALHKLTAFDCSVRFDRDISGHATTMSVQAHILSACSELHVSVSNTIDWSVLPNADEVVTISSSSIQTYRDLIEWCAALLGASAKIDRYGKFNLIRLKEKTDDNGYAFDAVISGNERFGTEFFDLRALTKYVSTTFDGQNYVYTRNNWLNDEYGRNAIVFVPENPLLDSKQNAKEVFENSLSAFSIALRHAEFSFMGNPAIECFDTIGANGGQIDLGRTIAIFPTKLVWKYRGGHNVSCAFAELTEETTIKPSEIATIAADTSQLPAPLRVKSQSDKRIDGIRNMAGYGVGKFANAEKDSEIFNDYHSNTSEGRYHHVEGLANKIQGGQGNHVEGNGNKINNGSYCHVDGQSHTVSGTSNHVSGYGSTVDGEFNSAVGQGHNVSGVDNLASGYTNTVGGRYNLTGGGLNKLNGTISQANVGAGWNNNFSEGSLQNSVFYGTNNSGSVSNGSIGGEENKLNGNCDTVNGRGNKVSDCNYSIVHGCYNEVSDSDNTIVVGYMNKVSGARNNAAVLGWYNELNGSSVGALVAGEFNTASGDAVTAAGMHNEVSNPYNTVFGKFNIDKDLALCIGNGTGDSNRSNALELDWEGNLHIAGRLIADGGIDGVDGGGGSSVEISEVIDETSTNDTATGSKAVYDFVSAKIANIPASVFPATMYAQSAAVEIDADSSAQIFRLRFDAAAECVPLLNVTAQYTLIDSGTVIFTLLFDGVVIAQFSQVSPAGKNFRSFAVPLINTAAGTHEISVYVGGADGMVTDTGYAVLTGYGLSKAADDEQGGDTADEPDRFAAAFKATAAPFKTEISVGRQTPLKVNVSEKMPPQKAEITAQLGD